MSTNGTPLILAALRAARQDRHDRIARELAAMMEAHDLADWSFSLVAWKMGAGEPPVLVLRHLAGSNTAQTLSELSTFYANSADKAGRGEPINAP